MQRKGKFMNKITNTNNCCSIISLNTTKLFLNMSTSLHTVFAANTHLAERQFFREERTANKGKSLKFRARSRMRYVTNNI